MNFQNPVRFAAAVTTVFVMASQAFAQRGVAPSAAQQPAPPGRGAAGGRGTAGPAIVSPEVMPDRRVVFRLMAPQAQAVRVAGGDMPALGRGAVAPGAPSAPPAGQMTKGENGVWTVTVGPVDAGAY